MFTLCGIRAVSRDRDSSRIVIRYVQSTFTSIYVILSYVVLIRREGLASPRQCYILSVSADAMRIVCTKVSRQFSGVPPPFPVLPNGGIRAVGGGAIVSQANCSESSTAQASNTSHIAGSSIAGVQGVECSSILDRELFSTSSVCTFVLSCAKNRVAVRVSLRFENSAYGEVETGHLDSEFFNPEIL